MRASLSERMRTRSRVMKRIGKGRRVRGRGAMRRKRMRENRTWRNGQRRRMREEGKEEEENHRKRRTGKRKRRGRERERLKVESDQNCCAYWLLNVTGGLSYIGLLSRPDSYRAACRTFEMSPSCQTVSKGGSNMGWCLGTWSCFKETTIV